MCNKTKEFILCRKCPQRKLGKPSNIPNGYYYDTVNGIQILRECDCHITWRKARELDTKLEAANLVSDYTFDNYRGTQSLEDLNALKTVADNFEKFQYRKMIYLYGPNGTQKTSMAQALGKELIKKGFTAQYILMQELINNLMPDFDKSVDKEAKEDFIKKCSSVDLLIIDESWDTKKVTLYNSGYQIPFLDSFLRTRFELNKGSILFISNHLPNEITSQGFGESLQSFVTRNTQKSLLKFEDKYIENANQIDRLALFK